MDLTKEKWIENDKEVFLEYLSSFLRNDKVAWTTNILKTPSKVLALLTKDMVTIARQIRKGNYKSFLDLQMTDYYETITLYGMLISRMNTYDEMLPYLEKYLDMMDCWAHCDILNFPEIKEKTTLYLNLSKKYRFDERVMVRRLSLFILFQLVKEKEYLNEIFNSLLDFASENEYYVIMMAGWLLSECIILHRDEALSFISNNNINKKIINKAIQKCRESNRLSKEEKDFLLKYKV